MKLNEILKPKSFSSIRAEIPSRFLYAMINGRLFNLETGKEYQYVSNFNDADVYMTQKGLFNALISSYNNNDEIFFGNEIYCGFNYLDYIILNELFTPIQKWDLLFCINLFNDEKKRLNIDFVNKTRKTYYSFGLDKHLFENSLLTYVKDLELVNLHLKFKDLGGSHETTSRFTDIVQRAGWLNGIKMIKALLIVFEKIIDQNILKKNIFMTHIMDRIQADEDFIIYHLRLEEPGYFILIRHHFENDRTSIRIIKNQDDIQEPIIFEWKNLDDE